MTEDLTRRLSALRSALMRAGETPGDALLDRLDEAVAELRHAGMPVPPWARERLARRLDARTEEAFDNLPV